MKTFYRTKTKEKGNKYYSSASQMIVPSKQIASCEPTSFELWVQKLGVRVYGIVSQQSDKFYASEPMSCKPLS